jgi:hypothetical protein
LDRFDLCIIDAGGERLPCAVRGPDGAPVRLLIVPPLFEEMNRARRLLARTGEALAGLGIASVLPDLPGTGDHEGGAEAMDWPRWRAAVAALAGTLGAAATVAVRGGVLLDDAAGARPRYRLAPVSGAALLRDLLRARAVSDAEAGAGMSVARLEASLAAGEAIEAAGHILSPALAAALRAASPAPARSGDRTAMLDGQPGGDVVLSGPAAWRVAEPAPAEEQALARALAADIAQWLASR